MTCKGKTTQEVVSSGDGIDLLFQIVMVLSNRIDTLENEVQKLKSPHQRRFQNLETTIQKIEKRSIEDHQIVQEIQKNHKDFKVQIDNFQENMNNLYHFNYQNHRLSLSIGRYVDIFESSSKYIQLEEEEDLQRDIQEFGLKPITRFQRSMYRGQKYRRQCLFLTLKKKGRLDTREIVHDFGVTHKTARSDMEFLYKMNRGVCILKRMGGNRGKPQYVLELLPTTNNSMNTAMC